MSAPAYFVIASYRRNRRFKGWAYYAAGKGCQAAWAPVWKAHRFTSEASASDSIKTLALPVGCKVLPVVKGAPELAKAVNQFASCVTAAVLAVVWLRGF